MKITEETKIKDLIPKGKEIGYVNLNSLGAINIITKDKKEIAEQEANKLGFSIGDNVFDNLTKEYRGKVDGFYFNDESILCCHTNNNKYKEHHLKFVTSRVAVLCPTEEDFEFINDYLKYDLFNNEIVYNKATSIKLNEVGYIDSLIYKALTEWLYISIDSYMKSQGIGPLTVTKDGKNLYVGMSYYYITVENNILKNKAISNGICTTFDVFSTYEAAKDYLNELKPRFKIGDCITNRMQLPKYFKVTDTTDTLYILENKDGGKDSLNITSQNNWELYKRTPLFYTEDFKDGSFPVKECHNCFKQPVNIEHSCKYLETCKDYNHYRLRGAPIHAGDRCWKVTKTGVECNTWNGNKVWEETKYFSSISNALSYYTKLRNMNEKKPNKSKKVEELKQVKQTTIDFNNTGCDLDIDNEKTKLIRLPNKLKIDKEREQLTNLTASPFTNGDWYHIHIPVIYDQVYLDNKSKFFKGLNEFEDNRYKLVTIEGKELNIGGTVYAVHYSNLSLWEFKIDKETKKNRDYRYYSEKQNAFDLIYGIKLNKLKQECNQC